MPSTTPRHAIRSDPHGREVTRPAPTRSHMREPAKNVLTCTDDTQARRSSAVVLTGLRPSPTRHAVVGFRFSGRLAQGPAVRLADRRHPPRLDVLTMTRSAYLQVRCAVVAQVERAVLTLHPPLRAWGVKLDSISPTLSVLAF